MLASNYPWASRALNIFAPWPEDVDRFCRFVREELVPDRIDTIMMIVRYNYAYTTHPECCGNHPLSLADVKKMVAVCKECGIRLIPNMNLLGHQTIQDYKEPDGLLRAHPEFSETPIDEEPEYAYSLCPSHPELKKYVTDMMDELIDAFEADMFHMGLDEVFYIGMCDRCKGKNPADLFADWVNGLAEHLLARGVTPMMWGDRLLDSKELGYGPWDASHVGTAPAIHKLNKNIIITDWHYHNWHHFPSPEIFAKEGFKVYLCPFNVTPNAKLFLDYAKEHDQGNILGIMETTWVPFRYFAEGLADNADALPDVKWYKGSLPHIAHVYRWLYRDGPLENPLLEDED